MSAERKYLLTFLALPAVLSAAVAGANLVVDPFDIFRVVSVPGFNRAKPLARFHDRMHKAWSVWHTRPDAVLLGTSRAQIGLDADFPGLKTRAERTLNLALPGGTPYEALRYLQQAHAHQRLKLAVVGLDLLMFNGGAARTNVEFDESRLWLNEAGALQSPLPPPADLAPTLLSTDALLASLRTVRKQSEGNYLESNGTRSTDVQLRAFRTLGGARKMVLDAEKTYFEWFRCFRLAGPGDPPHFEDFERLLEFAQTEGIELKLFLSPIHARQQELIRMTGQQDASDDWKRQLVRIVETSSGRHPQRPPLVLWDFSRAGDVTSEAMPILEDSQTQLSNYWDSSHYKASVGDRVLARVLELPGSEAEEFGFRLSAQHLEEQLEDLRSAQRQWSEASGGDLADLERLHGGMLAGSGVACSSLVAAGG